MAGGSSIFRPSLILLMQSSDAQATSNATILIEEGKWVALGNRWKARVENPHVDGMKKHNHLYLQGKEIFVINRDGTPSHGSDLSKMPPYVKELLKKKSLLEGHYVETAYADDPSLYISANLIEYVYDYIERQRRLMKLMSGIGYPSR